MYFIILQGGINLSQSKKAVKSAFIIIFFSFGSKILGFIREMLIAAKFGSALETDTFFIALSAISLFTTLITQSIVTTMIPVLSKIEAIDGKGNKEIHVNNFLNVFFMISIVILIFAWTLAPLILKVLAYGFKEEQFNLAVSMMRIGTPSICIAAVLGVFRGNLQSELLFTESAASDLPFNIVYIFFLLFLSNKYGIKGLMITSVFALGSKIIIQIPGIKRVGFKYRLKFNLKDKYLKDTMYLLPPILLSVGIADLNSIVDRSLSSTLIEGSISALNYANRMNTLITGIFIAAITTVTYPMLSEEANKDSFNGLKKVASHSINTILLITIPATIGMIILANPLVRVLFQRGAFDSNATHMTSGALVFYAIGLSGTALTSLLNNVYYSLQDTKSPMIFTVFCVAANIVLNLILIRIMQHRGLALATSISVNISAILLIYGLKRKIGSLEFMKSIKCGIKSLTASIIMGIAVYIIYNTAYTLLGDGLISCSIALALSIFIGILIYFIFVYLLKIEEVRWATKIMIDTLKNKMFQKDKRDL